MNSHAASVMSCIHADEHTAMHGRNGSMASPRRWLAICALLLAGSALAATDTWEGSGPFATGTGNKVINALAAAGDNETVYSGTGSGTVFRYVISPFVVSVAVPASGRYNPGDALDFTVSWSTNMAVTGTPQLAITLDGVTRYASYFDSPTGTTTRFRYVVQAGDTDADGIVIGVLGLNGGSIKSTGGAVAALALNSVGSTVGVLVDSNAPTLAAANIVVNNQSDPHRIVLTFSEVLASASIGSGTDWMVKANGGSPSYGVASVALTAAAEVTLTLDAVNIGSAATYIANSAANGHLKVTPYAGLTDLAGNAYAGGEVTESGAPHVLDTTAPTMAAVSADSATDTGGTLHATASEQSRGYWLAVASGAAAPTGAEVKAGADYGAVTVAAHGSGTLPAGVAGTVALSGLASGTAYDIHLAVEDAAGNLSAAIGSAALTTTRSGSCGSANGSAVTAAPTLNLCSVGAASAVAGTGPWTWTCAGTLGGADASCNAVVYVPPAVFSGGSGTVGSGDTGIVSGPAVVTANGGSTVVIDGSAAVGANIVIPPTNNVPVVVAIGGSSLTIASSGGTTQVAVVSLQDSTGTTQTVLRITGSGDTVQRIDNTAQPGGKVLFALEIGGNTVPVYSTGDVANLEMVCAPDGSCVCYVGRGSLTLDGLVVRSTARSTADASESQVVHAGELAAFDRSGNFIGLHLGTRAGTGTGDPLPLDLPANLTLATSVPRLDGDVVRLGGNLRDAVVAGAGGQLLNAGSDGVLVLDIGGLRVQALPLGSVTIESGRADGLAMAADGMALVTRNGVTVRLAPSVANLANFAGELAAMAPEATLRVHADGVLAATLAGTRFAVRPDWTVALGVEQADGFATDAAGRLCYVQDRHLQALYPAFAEYTRLVQAVGQAVPGATAATSGDGTVTLTLGGQAWMLVPAYTLETAPAGDSLWWPNATGDGFMLRNGDGTMQEFRAE